MLAYLLTPRPTPAAGQRMGQIDLRRRPRPLAFHDARARHGIRRNRGRGLFGRVAAQGADPRGGSEKKGTGGVHGASELLDVGLRGQVWRCRGLSCCFARARNGACICLPRFVFSAARSCCCRNMIVLRGCGVRQQSHRGSGFLVCGEVSPLVECAANVFSASCSRRV